ncbi:MAG: hypothetical protein HZC17_04910 [Candidatus Omnitrophica bacterium]|nr:hypothetical protein [Candidatus Omnitrophota bacterium]
MKIDFLFHPILIHFPIAFYFLELFLLAIWGVKKDAAQLAFARFAFRIGYVFMIPTMIAGLIDAGGLPKQVWEHASFAAGVFIVYTGRFFYWQMARPEQKYYKFWLIASAFAGYILVILTGFEGGELVYDAPEK